jgi:hypothetical protein
LFWYSSDFSGTCSDGIVDSLGLFNYKVLINVKRITNLTSTISKLCKLVTKKFTNACQTSKVEQLAAITKLIYDAKQTKDSEGQQ